MSISIPTPNFEKSEKNLLDNGDGKILITQPVYRVDTEFDLVPALAQSGWSGRL